MDINTAAVGQLKFLQSPTKNNYIDDLAGLTHWFAKSQQVREERKEFSNESTENEDRFIDLLIEFFDLIQPKHNSMLGTGKYSNNNLKYMLLKLKLASEKLDCTQIDRYVQNLGYTNFSGKI